MSSTTVIRRRIEKSQRGSEESPIAKWTLVTIALAFVVVFLLLPLVNVFYQAFSHGIRAYFDAITGRNPRYSEWLTPVFASAPVRA